MYGGELNIYNLYSECAGGAKSRGLHFDEALQKVTTSDFGWPFSSLKHLHTDREVLAYKEGMTHFGRKEGNVLFNDALNTFYLQLSGRKEMFYLTTHSTHFIYGYMEGRKEMFYLTMHSTHFIYGYMEGRKCFI